MSDAPERIWLQDAGDYSKARMAGYDLTWCEDRVNDADTEYRRADLPPTDEQIMAHPKVRALVQAAEAEAEKWKKAFAAQSNKLQSVLHIEGVRDTLRDLKGGEE